MAANSTERLHHSSRSDKPETVAAGGGWRPNGLAHTITPVFVTGQRLPLAALQERAASAARGGDSQAALGW